MKKAGAAALALSVCLLVSAPLGCRAAENPHAVMAAQGGCQDCHLDQPSWSEPVKRPLRFKRDIVSICVKCHEGKDLASLHPVDIRPGMKVPDRYPLDESGQITCATCHNPHGDFEAEKPYVAQALATRLLSLFTPGKKHRTFFLRAPNIDGHLCRACHAEGAVGGAGFHVREDSLLDQYVGSAKCGECHEDKYREWQLSAHARMTSDPEKSPEMLLGDFETDPPFRREDVVYVLGSHWTQRYVVDIGGRLHVKAPLWSITSKSWDRSYWSDKPWDLFCQGCHTTGFEMKGEPAFSELGVSCEACHGPGLAHAGGEGAGQIINPAKLDPERSEMICQSCHTSGHDPTGQFRFPLGFIPGRDLTRYYKGLMPKAGQDNETFMGDDSYADRRRQWEYWKDSFFNTRGASCDICKNFRTNKNAAVKMNVSQYCMSCHDKSWPEPGLHESHLGGDVHCDKCHIPKLAPDGEGYSIHDHKFFFGAAEVSEWKPLRETCAQCHED